jgi:hypothetical protein
MESTARDRRNYHQTTSFNSIQQSKATAATAAAAADARARAFRFKLVVVGGGGGAGSHVAAMINTTAHRH